MMNIPQKKIESANLGDLEVPWTQSERYYFAYGSNMNAEQMQSRGARPLSVVVAKLPDHAIAFHGYSKTWDGAVETVVSAPGHEVWGVIYKLTFSDANSLDSWQDVRLDGTGAYFLFPTSVIDTEGRAQSVLLYKKDVLEAPQKPSREVPRFHNPGSLGTRASFQLHRGIAEHRIQKSGIQGSQTHEIRRGAPSDDILFRMRGLARFQGRFLLYEGPE